MPSTPGAFGPHSRYGRETQRPLADRRKGGEAMKIASAAEVKAQFEAFLKSSAIGPVVVTRAGRPVALLIGLDNEEEIERLLMAHSQGLRAILEKSRRQIREGRGIGHEQFWAEMRAATAGKRRNGTKTKNAGKLAD